MAVRRAINAVIGVAAVVTLAPLANTVDVEAAQSSSLAAADRPQSFDSPEAPELGDPAFSDIPPERLASYERSAPTEGSSQLQQTMTVSVKGGDLTIEPQSVEVPLTAVSGRLRGSLPTITVVDARGSNAGWTVTARLERVEFDGGRWVPAGHVALAPAVPQVTAGLGDGVSAGRTFRGRGKGTLCRADVGAGAGTTECGGTIDVKRPNSTGATAIVTLSVN